MLQPAPVQSTYIRYLLPAQNGMLASSVGWDADTRIIETAGGIGFGLAVSQGSLSSEGCIIGGSAFVGITKADQTLPQAGGITTVDTYSQYDNAGIHTRGDLWVFTDNAVTAGEAVYYSATTGKFGHSGGTLIEDARWMTAGPAGSLQVVRLGNIAGNR